MDNKKLKELIYAWFNAAGPELPFRTAPGNRAVTWEANSPVWWSQWGGVRCIGLTVLGYVTDWAGALRLNLIITDNGQYVVTKNKGDYGYLRDEAEAEFVKTIPPANDPLVISLERWKQAVIDDLNKLEFSEVQMMKDTGKDPKAFFTIRHPDMPKLAVTVDLDADSFNVQFAHGCRSSPMAKMLTDAIYRVEGSVWRAEEKAAE